MDHGLDGKSWIDRGILTLLFPFDPFRESGYRSAYVVQPIESRNA